MACMLKWMYDNHNRKCYFSFYMDTRITTCDIHIPITLSDYKPSKRAHVIYPYVPKVHYRILVLIIYTQMFVDYLKFFFSFLFNFFVL